MVVHDEEAAIRRSLARYESVLEVAAQSEPAGVRLDSFGRVHALHNIGDLSEKLAAILERTNAAAAGEVAQLRAQAKDCRERVAAMQQGDTAAVRATVQKSFGDALKKCRAVAWTFSKPEDVDRSSRSKGASASSSSASSSARASGAAAAGQPRRPVHAPSTAVSDAEVQAMITAANQSDAPITDASDV